MVYFGLLVELGLLWSIGRTLSRLMQDAYQVESFKVDLNSWDANRNLVSALKVKNQKTASVYPCFTTIGFF